MSTTWAAPRCDSSVDDGKASNLRVFPNPMGAWANPDRVMDRALFCHATAEEMRRVLIDHARPRGPASRRGG